MFNNYNMNNYLYMLMLVLHGIVWNPYTILGIIDRVVLTCRKEDDTSFLFPGSKRISDSEVSDYDCDDGIGVVSGTNV